MIKVNNYYFLMTILTITFIISCNDSGNNKKEIEKEEIPHILNFTELEKKDIIEAVNDFLWIELIDDKIEIDDVIWTKWEKHLSEYIWKMAIEELEKIKGKVPNIEDFYDLERRIVLQSVDDLWMRHIDGMSHLREEVAFEWYAQKNPLVVYKEKAFWMFNDLMHDIEYKVVKAIFGVDVNANVEQRNINTQDLKINEEDLEKMLENFSEAEKESLTSSLKNQNQLFANHAMGAGNNINDSWNGGKKRKIKV